MLRNINRRRSDKANATGNGLVVSGIGGIVWLWKPGGGQKRNSAPARRVARGIGKP